MKQWGQKPEEISPEVTGRVPVLISYDNRYFQDKYQGVPKDGFTPMFEHMLDHENIEVVLDTDCRGVLKFTGNEILFEGKPFEGDVIYTGALDELFDCKFGRLPYRSLDFHFEHYDEESYQGHSVVNYTVSEDYTRITEFKFLTGQKNTDGTTIVKEYPFAYFESEWSGHKYSIYPFHNRKILLINMEHAEAVENQALYGKYRALTAGLPKFHLLGRLAEYKYYNIDAMTKKAMELADAIMNQ
jgi:UDP-galactopyranose mutase